MRGIGQGHTMRDMYYWVSPRDNQDTNCGISDYISKSAKSKSLVKSQVKWLNFEMRAKRETKAESTVLVIFLALRIKLQSPLRAL